MTSLSGPLTENPGLGLGHLFMHVMGATDGTLEMVEMGGTQAENRGQVPPLVTLITGTVARRAETRTSELPHGILHTGDSLSVHLPSVQS